MTSHQFSSRFSGIALGHLALAVIFSACWATSAAFADVSGSTHAVSPVGVRPGDSRRQASGSNSSGPAVGSIGLTDGQDEQYGFFNENGATYDLNRLIGNAPYGLTSTENINDKGQVAAHQYGPTGQIETVLLTPTSIPLPSAPWAALTVVPLMFLARRSRHFRR